MDASFCAAWSSSLPFLLLAVGAGVVVLRWPSLGLALLLIGSLTVPLAVPTGARTSINFTALAVPILTVLWALRVAWRRDWRVFSQRPMPPLLAFVATATVSFAAVNQPWVYVAPLAPLRAQLGGLSVFVFSAAVFIMAADQLRDLRWLQLLTGLFLILGALYIAGRILPRLGDAILPAFQKGADGSLFWTWLVALAFSQAAFNRHLHMLVRVVLAVLVLATFWVGLTQGRDWVSGWLPPLVAVVATLCVGAPRLGAVATVAAGVGAASQIPRLVAFVLSPDNQYSLMTRVEAWRVLAKVALASPALGFGPANYYHVTPLFPIFGYYIRFSSHNTYVDILAQTGLIGLACFAWFFWEVARVGWRLRREAAAGFPRAYVYGALGGFAGTLAAGMLGDWLLPFVYNVTLSGLRASVLGWMFLGGLIAMAATPTSTARRE